MGERLDGAASSPSWIELDPAGLALFPGGIPPAPASPGAPPAPAFQQRPQLYRASRPFLPRVQAGSWARCSGSHQQVLREHGSAWLWLLSEEGWEDF